ncbi:MAG: CDP-2,3-bis-(O-geranylgeranyl)-sn-glycerol synthase [Candidatus Bathyarchaeota archaeon]|nr:MAG: CDP-2,3-bis-(O-geranylgeranyl)-sn-glycerol synthase [Candidatus Bathyarchaeota archaeon]
MIEIISSIISALYFIFPAYCANAAPLILGGGIPLDWGRNFVDGKPILGSHKTVRGFLAGLAAGFSVGLIQFIMFQSNEFLQKTLLFQPSVQLGLMLSLGAMIGDSLESFFKRRLGLQPGASLLIADQLDFVVGALLLSLPVSPPSLLMVMIIILITPPIHILSNFLGDLLRRKRLS